MFNTMLNTFIQSTKLSQEIGIIPLNISETLINLDCYGLSHSGTLQNHNVEF